MFFYSLIGIVVFGSECSHHLRVVHRRSRKLLLLLTIAV